MICLLEASSSYKINIIVYGVTQGDCKNSVFMLRRNPSRNWVILIFCGQKPELSLYFSHHKITFKGKKAEKVAMIKAHIGSLLYNSMERQQPQQLPLTNLRQQVTSISLSKVETDSQSDIVDQVVGSSPCSLSEESSPETDFIPEPCAEKSRYGWKRKRVEKDNYVSWEKIVFWYINFSTTVNNLQGFW